MVINPLTFCIVRPAYGGTTPYHQPTGIADVRSGNFELKKDK